MHKVLYKHIEVKAKASFMQIQHVRRLSFMINDLEEGQVEKEENIMKKALPLIMAALAVICVTVSFLFFKWE